jgi:signal recognition particle receptor subunit beta
MRGSFDGLLDRQAVLWVNTMSSPIAVQAHFNVGVPSVLGDLRNALLKRGSWLQHYVPQPVGQFVSDLANNLEHHSCRIAFIGQVKAGKSSLINALLEKPDLLPTDVNPSTAVVTKVHLGQRRLENSSVFNFFSEAEWTGMGGPDSGASAFANDYRASKQRLARLEDRARSQIGKSYKDLLGRHHLFSSVTADLLGKYVSANDDNGKKEPVFSSLIKSADLYMNDFTDAYPSVIIDTPGVNDLFFIRDDITYNNISDADVYILTLSTDRVVSEADLTLLRMLKGMRKDRIIAVVNRFDIIADDSPRIRDVESNVRAFLEREFPAISIPIVFVSAEWARRGILDNRDSNARTLVYPQEDYLKKSCIDKVRQTIGTIIVSTVVEDRLVPCVSIFSSITNNTLASLKFCQQTFRPELWSSMPKTQVTSILAESIRKLQLLADNINEFLDRIADKLQEIMEAETTKLLVFFRRSVLEFAKREAANFLRQPTSVFFQEFANAALALRTELSDQFTRYQPELFRVLSEHFRDCEGELRNLIKSRLPTLEAILQLGVASQKGYSLSAVALGKSTLLEDVDFWEWFSKPHHGRQTSEEELQRAITSEMLFVIDSVIDAMRADVTAYIGASIARFRHLCNSLTMGIERETLAFASIHEKGLSRTDLSEAMLAMCRQRQAAMNELETGSLDLIAIRKSCFSVPKT